MKFYFKKTDQTIETTDLKQIAQFKKDPRFVVVKEPKKEVKKAE